MSEAYTLPPDLTDEEAALVAALRAERLREADEDAALIVRVKRLNERLRADGVRKPLRLVTITERLPVSDGTARRIIYGQGRWGVPR